MGGENNEICKRDSYRISNNSCSIYDVLRRNVKQKENDETSKKMGKQNGNVKGKQRGHDKGTYLLSLVFQDLF